MVSLVKSLPDKRRPLVKIYAVEVDGKPAYLVKWKDPRSGRWVSKRRRDLKKAEQVAGAALESCNNGGTHDGLLTAIDQERLDLARKIPIDRLRQIANECESIARRVTFAEWLEEYKDIIRNRSQQTQREVRITGGRVANYFGEYFLDAIPLAEVEKWYSKRLSEVSKRTANNEAQLFGRLLNEAKAQKRLPSEPTVIDQLKLVNIPQGEVGIWDLVTVRRMLQNLPGPKFAPFLLIGLFAGLRTSEIEGITGERVGLDWSNINFEDGYIEVSKDVAAKNTGVRFVKLHPNLAEWLLPYRKSSGLVCNRTSRRSISKHYRDLGICEKWVENGLRHSFCSYLLAKCQSIGHVAEQAGNSESVIRTNYKRPIPMAHGEEYFSLTPDSVRETESNIIKIA